MSRLVLDIITSHRVGYTFVYLLVKYSSALHRVFVHSSSRLSLFVTYVKDTQSIDTACAGASYPAVTPKEISRSLIRRFVYDIRLQKLGFALGGTKSR